MTEPGKSPGRRRAEQLVKIVVAMALLAGLLVFVVDPQALLQEMLRCSPIAMLAAAVAFTAGRFVIALRWLLLVRSTHAAVTFTELARLTLMGASVGFFAPGMIGTEAYRVAGLARTTGVGTAVASVMVERLTSIFGLAAMGALGLALSDLPMPVEVQYALFAGCLGIMLATLLTMAPPFRHLVDVSIGWLPAGIAKKLGGLLRAVQTYAGQPLLLGQLFLLSIALQAARFAATLALAWGLGMTVGIGTLLLVMTIGMFMMLLPLTPQGLGTREVAYAALLGAVGVPAEEAVALSLLTFGISMLVVAAPALWFYLRYGVWGQAPTAPGKPPAPR